MPCLTSADICFSRAVIFALVFFSTERMKVYFFFAVALSELVEIEEFESDLSRPLKCFECSKTRTGFENDDWFYKCLYPKIEDIGHLENGTT